MIYFYTQNEDGTLSKISTDRISELYVDATPQDFEIAKEVPYIYKVIDGALVTIGDVKAVVQEKVNAIKVLQYKRRVMSLIRKEWNINDELALINTRDEEPEKYAAYRARVKEIKVQAKKEIGIDE